MPPQDTVPDGPNKDAQTQTAPYWGQAGAPLPGVFAHDASAEAIPDISLTNQADGYDAESEGETEEPQDWSEVLRPVRAIPPAHWDRYAERVREGSAEGDDSSD
jgi:hypothetical protein